ncbi:MAG TPA: sterol desaturase family protein [Puia sp.]|nr:sterol desaturase family protein [Puia sp.]
MSGAIVCGAVTAGAFIGMEGVAWSAHKYLMHGWLWTLHRDHHRKDHGGFFERNDFFFLIFAIPGVLGLLFGVMHGFTWLFWAGLGVTLYGMAYFLVHDVFIHQRFRLFRHTDNRYFRAIRRAHKMHHRHPGKEDGECFGMLWVPWNLLRKKS